MPTHVNCNKQSISRGSPQVKLALNEGDQLLQRFTRSLKYNNFSSSRFNKAEAINSTGYLASYGLRTKYKPQEFFSKQQKTPTGSTINDLTSYNLITESRKDICKDHCSCKRGGNAFLSSIFDKSFKVPLDATVIFIKLGRNVQFRLDRGFFNNNTVNSLTIEGQHKDGEQIEINTEAFRGNNGPYPEINFNNVFTVIIRTKAFSGNCKFTVRNSNDLILYADAFENAKINGLLVGIKDLRIGEKAFNSAHAKLRIESSNIDNIYRFEASLREIRFVNCTIGTINAGTFDVIKINSIVFESCRIDVIKARAITEKLFSDHVSIMDASIGFIESEAIYGSGITELILTNNRIDTIHENAIYVTSINATIANNNIKHLGNNWLRVKGWSNIVVEKNQFGVFGGIVLEADAQPVNCRFDGNSLTQPLSGSLNITNPYCILREISIKTPCRCNLDWLDRLSARDLRSEIYCTVDDKLGNCFNSSTFNTLKYLNEVCDDTKTVLDCVANKNLKKIDGHFFTPEELEQRNNRLPELLLILIGSLFILLLISVGVIILICRFKETSCSMSQSSSGIQARAHLHEFNREERLIIDQSLQLIQKKYPEIYKKINERAQRMLTQDLNEEKCVKCISEIVNILNKVQNSSNDFVAFNRILTEHLQSPLPNTPPADQIGIYSEPGLEGIEGDFYATNSFPRLEQNNDSSILEAGAEPIYAEPTCAQQPLLRNEYASPADRQPPVIDLYTEPIHETGSHINQHYAVTTTIPCNTYHCSRRTTQYAIPKRDQPSISQQVQQQQHRLHIPPNVTDNLPDVLSQRTLTNVRKIAQDLQVKTNFNPTVKPKNMHIVMPPCYTAPGVRHKHLIKNEFELDMRGATALPPDSGSSHSGGSNETVKIDDVIEYADA
uniref:Right handed beta helix domain-containing protein n=1 Tax=Glossina brevipalpis TaxID=37001 RepID=A0A1A9WVB5_9MUSC